jgi:hypothetical protein
MQNAVREGKLYSDFVLAFNKLVSKQTGVQTGLRRRFACGASLNLGIFIGLLVAANYMRAV